jgi:hypothetical protein
MSGSVEVIPGREPKARLRASATRYGSRTQNPDAPPACDFWIPDRAFGASGMTLRLQLNFRFAALMTA